MNAYIITLSRIPESLQTSTAMIDPLRDCGLTVELFEGTYPDEADQLFRRENRTIAPISYLGNRIPDYKIDVSGVRGCFYSHYRLWQKCLDINEPILIFEDDVVITGRYLPVKWDEIIILSFGGWWRTQLPSKLFLENFNNKSATAKAMEYPGECLPGTVAYGITPQAAGKLVDCYATSYSAADHAVMSSIVKLQIHSHLVGYPLCDEHGKRSLVATRPLQ